MLGWGARILSCFGYAVLAIVFVAFFYWVTRPTADQVCRQNNDSMVAWWQGTGWQPTCQEYMRKIERRAIQAESHAADLEERVEEIETRLQM